jgi:hypothetical protein
MLGCVVSPDEVARLTSSALAPFGLSTRATLGAEYATIGAVGKFVQMLNVP